MRSFSFPPELTKKSINTLFVSFSVAALISACTPESSPSGVVESGAISAQAENLSETDSLKQVQIRWTTHGIPHVKADDWEGLGYGFAHAIATNTICVLAREFVTVRGEQAKYFGAAEHSQNKEQTGVSQNKGQIPS